MLNDLDGRRGVEPRQTGVAVEERAVEEPDALTELRGGVVQMKPVASPLERANRDVQPDDLGELPVGEKFAEESAFAAPEVKDAPGPGLLERGVDGLHPLVVEPNGLLDGLLGRCFLIGLIGDRVEGGEPVEGGPGERPEPGGTAS